MPLQFSRTEVFISVENKIIPKVFFKRMGNEMTVTCGDTVFDSFNAIIQPLRYKNKMYLSSTPTELGYDFLNKYLLIAPPEARLDLVDGDEYVLMYDGHRFEVDRSEKVSFKGNDVYYWAIISKGG